MNDFFDLLGREAKQDEIICLLAGLKGTVKNFAPLGGQIARFDQIFVDGAPEPSMFDKLLASLEHDCASRVKAGVVGSVDGKVKPFSLELRLG